MDDRDSCSWLLLLLSNVRSLGKNEFECEVPVNNCCFTSSNEITKWAALRMKFMLVMSQTLLLTVYDAVQMLLRNYFSLKTLRHVQVQ